MAKKQTSITEWTPDLIKSKLRTSIAFSDNNTLARAVSVLSKIVLLDEMKPKISHDSVYYKRRMQLIEDYCEITGSESVNNVAPI